MWKLRSLNTKLLVLLIIVQAIILSMGVFGLLEWATSKRTDDLAHRIDSQSDQLEDLIQIENGKWVYHNNSEFGREISNDPLFYFELQDATHNVVIESGSVSSESRKKLAVQLARELIEDEGAITLTLEHKQWMFHRADIKRNYNGLVVTATLYAGFNIDNAYEELEILRGLAAFIIFIVLLLTAISSYFIVRYSTRNLRAFSNNIRAIKSPDFSGRLVLTPSSAEEKLLFDSYAEMINTITSAMDNQRLFIANASHELKTPIAAALLALEVLLAKPRSVEDYEDTCRGVLAELQILRRLSAALLDLARLDDAGATTKTCNLAEVIPNVLNRWQKQADTKNINLHSAIDQHHYVSGSPESWEVIFSNLIDNAIKYGNHNGNVWITLEKTQAGLEASIVDDGIGMSEEEINQLGTVFYRADPARSNSNSFGLGFAQAKRLIEASGGSIKVNKSDTGGINVVIILHS